MNPENKAIPSSCLEYYSHLPGQNSIPLHALQGGGKKSYDIYSGNETKTQYVVFEHQALVDVLMSLHDLIIPIFAHEITKVIKFILNVH